MSHLPLKTIILLIAVLSSCTTNDRHVDNVEKSVRPLRDTIGFASEAWQMDSLFARIERTDQAHLSNDTLRMALCPHDDYSYVGKQYPEVLSGIKANTVIIIGVAHKAAALGIEDSLVFDSFSHWMGPWDDVPVSGMRDEIFKLLKGNYAIKSDTMHKIEHSLEALLPFLQYFNRDIEIVPLLVPAMDTMRMRECGRALAGAISDYASEKRLEWGRDLALVVTSDAVHYGNLEWGGKDYAPYGCDQEGNAKAEEHEHQIINDCLLGKIRPDKIRRFSEYTLKPGNHREYIWTWCGRYSIPLTLWTAYYLDESRTIGGHLLDYYTSITNPHIPVSDLGMGQTAIAADCHWVGYASLVYR